MKYRIVREPSLDELEDAVKFFFLSEGWEAQGGVCYDGKRYIQAVIKRNKV